MVPTGLRGKCVLAQFTVTGLHGNVAGAHFIAAIQ